jgi:pilus assembly protein Flp/PilA
MLKFYVKASETLRQLRSDKNGVVSFEYVIVAAAIVGAVVVAFGTASGVGAISTALSNAIAAIVLKI